MMDADDFRRRIELVFSPQDDEERAWLERFIQRMATFVPLIDRITDAEYTAIIEAADEAPEVCGDGTDYPD